MTESEQRILLDRRGSILIITINRPDVRNAFDKVSGEAMQNAMDILDHDDGLFLGIVTGIGGNFSAGADLNMIARGESSRTERGGFGIFERPARKPLIAAVEGYALGGGFELCLSCDLIVAARDAKMGLTEVRHNVVAIGGGLFRLPRRIPYHVAMELALTGAIQGAEFFHRFGLVNRLVESGKALDEAIVFGEQILANGPTALAASKEIIFQSANWTDREGWSEQKPIAAVAFDAEDRAEGLRAFAEKRRPVWRGR
jgi:enoyl-CoA hydratase